jgi:hypothetical protein
MLYDAMATTIEGLKPNEAQRRQGLREDIWRAHEAGQLSDDQAQELAERIERQQRAGKTRWRLITGSSPRSYIQRSPEQKSPNRRASIERRRLHAASGMLPPAIAANYTMGEQAVLRVVADEWLAHGACDLSRNEIAARAGVSHALAKRTLLMVERDCLIAVQRRPRSGRKHLTNITRIVRAEWIDWLNKGNRKSRAMVNCFLAKPDFPRVRGVQKSPPRAQVRNPSISLVVDNSGKEVKSDGA